MPSTMFQRRHTEDYDEETRLARRRSVRAQIADAKITKKRIGELTTAINEIEAQIDEAADDHQAEAKKIQDELAQIRQQQIDRAADRKEADVTLENRRLELQEQLRALNTDLEQKCQALRAELKPLKQERHELKRPGVSLSLNLLENQLTRDLACPELLKKGEAIKVVLKALSFGSSDVAKTLKKQRSALAGAKERKEADSIKIYERRIARLEVTEQMIGKYVNLANQEAAQIRRELLEE